MTEHLSSFLVPTIITGSATYINGRRFLLELGNIQRLLLISVRTVETNNPLVIKIYTGTAIIKDAQYGYVDLYTPPMYGVFESAQVVYESGLSSGTYTQPMLLVALTTAAQIHLNEMDISLSNESTADVGVQQFSNQSYSEMRSKMGSSVFGNSAVAQRIARLVKKYRARPGIILR